MFVVDEFAFDFPSTVFCEIHPCSNFALSAILGETLLPKGAYEPWGHFQGYREVKHITINHIFCFLGISLSFVSSLYNLSLITFNAPPPPQAGGGGSDGTGTLTPCPSAGGPVSHGGGGGPPGAGAFPPPRPLGRQPQVLDVLD